MLVVQYADIIMYTNTHIHAYFKNLSKSLILAPSTTTSIDDDDGHHQHANNNDPATNDDDNPTTTNDDDNDSTSANPLFRDRAYSNYHNSTDCDSSYSIHCHRVPVPRRHSADTAYYSTLTFHKISLSPHFR